MFGSAARLEKKLREGGGKTAPATVTEAKRGHVAISSGGDAAQQAASAHYNWTLKLRVTPDGESPFDTELKEPYPEMGGGPAIGSVVGVLYDPTDHSKVVIDHSSVGTATMITSRMSPETTAALESIGGESAQDLMQEAITDPAAFRDKMRPQGSGPVVIVGGQRVSGFAPAAATPTDPADEIAKLAELRDRGALTEAEFQAQKKKVLGG